MLIRYSHIGDQCIVNVPDNAYWEIRFRMFDTETGVDDFNLYLITEDKEIMLRDTDDLCQGRNLSYIAVGNMHEEMVSVIADKIAKDPNLRLLDIDAIEAELLTSKYEKMWLEKGYITLDPDGSW